MDFSHTLAGFKKDIDQQLKAYFEQTIKKVQKKDALLAEALRYTQEIALAGGKRIRGSLVGVSYQGLGGQEKKKILRIALAIELVHLYLLIHDDIIDHGKLRHGKMTLHERLAQKYAKGKVAAEAKHFGSSLAIVVGDYLYAEAQQIILQSGFVEKLTTQVLSQLQKIVTNTIVGQSQDIFIAFDKKAGEQQILAMYENKTAKYTFEGPLHLGAILSGKGNVATLRSLSKYALPVGIAFQIQDDILGIFENNKQTGKSGSSDIEEGKQTLLVQKAQAEASKTQKKTLAAILGQQKLTARQIADFRHILIATRALQECQQLATAYFTQSKKALQKIELQTSQQQFLLGMVEYLESRRY